MNVFNGGVGDVFVQPIYKKNYFFKNYIFIRPGGIGGQTPPTPPSTILCILNLNRIGTQHGLSVQTVDRL
jgi:hypothetical protein